MTVPWQLSAYGDSLPTRLEQSEAHPIDGSLLPNDPSGIGYGTINGNATSLSLSAISPPVPEPSTLLLLGMGLMGLGLRVRGTWLSDAGPPRDAAPGVHRLWMIAMMLPSLSLNHAALAPPAVTTPLALLSPGRS